MSVGDLVASVIPMVKAVAFELGRGLRVDLDELIADGYLGAVKAANAFDPERGMLFATFARYRIRGEMIDGLRRMDYLNRRQRAESTAGWKAAEAAGHEYIDDRVAPPLSLEMPIGILGGDGMQLGDVVTDPDLNIEETYADLDLLSWAMQFLAGRQAEIVRRMYFEGEPHLPIAADWGVTVSRVAQIHNEALHTLRVAFLRSGVDTVALVDAVRAVSGRRRASRLEPVEREALFGDLLKFWSAA